MLSAFASFALLLTAVGLYGVMSYLVSQSTRELGVRIALGARPSDIIGMVVRQAMELSAVGILAGLAGAAAVTRVMASLLFGVSAIDGATFAAVACAAIQFLRCAPLGWTLWLHCEKNSGVCRAFIHFAVSPLGFQPRLPDSSGDR
jgi:putative ABC transport system permease protein